MSASFRLVASTCTRSVLAGGLVLLAGSSDVSGRGASPAREVAQARANTDATIMAAFGERVQAYADLHRKVEASLPTLPDEATPAAIDTHQRAFAARMAKARLSLIHI